MRAGVTTVTIWVSITDDSTHRTAPRAGAECAAGHDSAAVVHHLGHHHGCGGLPQHGVDVGGRGALPQHGVDVGGRGALEAAVGGSGCMVEREVGEEVVTKVVTKVVTEVVMAWVTEVLISGVFTVLEHLWW